MVAALDQFDEHRRPVLQRLREDLQSIPVSNRPRFYDIVVHRLDVRLRKMIGFSTGLGFITSHGLREIFLINLPFVHPLKAGERNFFTQFHATRSK